LEFYSSGLFFYPKISSTDVNPPLFHSLKRELKPNIMETYKKLEVIKHLLLTAFGGTILILLIVLSS